jgi:hypothetical protein
MLQQENKNTRFIKSCYTIGLICLLIVSCTSSILFRPATAAQLITPILLPTSNIASTETSYQIFFTAAHPGILAKITIAFPPNSSSYPSGFLVDSPILIDTSGIGDGKIKGNTNGTMTYTVTSPVSVPNGRPIRLQVANITNISYPGTFHITITTMNSLGKTIDTFSTYVRITQIKSAAMESVSVGTTQLAANAVTNSNLADEPITSEKIGNGEIKSNNIGDGQIMTNNLADESITSEKIGNGEIKSNNIGDGQIMTNNLANKSVNYDNIAHGAVGLVIVPEPPYQYTVLASPNVDLENGTLTSPSCSSEYPIPINRYIQADGDFYIQQDYPSGGNPSQGIPPPSWTIVVHNPNPAVELHIDLGVYCAHVLP